MFIDRPEVLSKTAEKFTFPVGPYTSLGAAGGVAADAISNREGKLSPGSSALRGGLAGGLLGAGAAGLAHRRLHPAVLAVGGGLGAVGGALGGVGSNLAHRGVNSLYESEKVSFASFVDEYQHIQKEAALGQFLSGGAKAIKGGFTAAKKGWQGNKALAGGEKGLSGAREGVKNYWNRLGATQKGKQMQTGAKAIGAGAGLAAGSLAAGKMMG